MLYPKYNVLFMRLNAALAMDDVEASERIIREMGSLKMSEEQTLALAAKAFSFYVEIGDEPHAREVLSYLEEHGDREAARAIASALSGRSQQPCLTSREESRRFIC